MKASVLSPDQCQIAKVKRCKMELEYLRHRSFSVVVAIVDWLDTNGAQDWEQGRIQAEKFHGKKTEIVARIYHGNNMLEESRRQLQLEQDELKRPCFPTLQPRVSQIISILCTRVGEEIVASPATPKTYNRKKPTLKRDDALVFAKKAIPELKEAFETKMIFGAKPPKAPKKSKVKTAFVAALPAPETA